MARMVTMAASCTSAAEVDGDPAIGRRARGWLDAEAFSPIGDKPVLVLDARERPPALQSVIIGIDAKGRLDCGDIAHYDILLTSALAAPAPWISVAGAALSTEADRLVRSVRQTPFATAILCRLLRFTETLSFDDALACESLAYSTLLGGSEFKRWLAARGVIPTREPRACPVRTDRRGDKVTITLDDPVSGNAMSSAMRDALFETLCAALDDPSRPHVTLRSEGRCFSTGGALAEFGTAPDLATAHAVRTLRNGARLIYALGDRAEVHIQGAAIGSGLELAAAAATRRATEHAWFQLPELAMGLLPGAGGTVALPRAIGRHRTAWLALSGKRLRAREALSLGLIHSIDQP